MRIFHLIPAAVSSLVFLSQSQLAAASPVSLGDPDIEKRCSNPCGFYSQLCCTSGQTCVTNGGQAVCSDSSSGSGSSGGSSGSGSGGGDWDYYTSTWVVQETEAATMTSTWSSRRSPAPTAAAGAGSNSGSGSGSNSGSGSGSGSGSSSGSGSCDSSVGETLCGGTCCGAAYVCNGGQCLAGSSSIWATATATSAPEGSSSGLAAASETGNPTTTQAFETPVSTDGSAMLGVKAPSDKGLSGGAIAGIVIGTIAGVALLLLICACMCCRGALNAFLACLGVGKRKRRDDRYSHGGRPGRTWFGTRPHAGSHAGGGEKKSKWGGLAAIGLVLGALALCLGLKKHRDHDEKSSYSYPSSYYYSDYYTNSSMFTSRYP